ncbi:hypothetical protein [Marinomonas spartinae]|uniref:hypothetical protein n=1 Tax=Marinomonas spartinae TaxID=1792290 RepID=UPI0018F18FA8|nr:hypothetical protein [Marinomonas spartinae]MBJ7555405.1 hypothetical protein [Marinomonas spartinae]
MLKHRKYQSKPPKTDIGFQIFYLFFSFILGIGLAIDNNFSGIKFTDVITSLASLGVFALAVYSYGQWREQHNAQVTEEVKKRLKEAIYSAHDIDNKIMQLNREINFRSKEAESFIRDVEVLQSKALELHREIQTFGSGSYGIYPEEQGLLIIKEEKDLINEAKQVQEKAEQYNKIARDSFSLKFQAKEKLITFTHKIESICYELGFYKDFSNISFHQVIDNRKSMTEKDFINYEELMIEQRKEIEFLMLTLNGIDNTQK